MKQIAEWKVELIESTLAYIDEVAIKDKEWQDQYGWRKVSYPRYRQEVPRIYLELSKNGEAYKYEKVEKMVNNHFDKLQAKVEAKIGKIEKIQATGSNGHDYIFKGENGSCSVEVIGAGGYNIQRYHTRWIIK